MILSYMFFSSVEGSLYIFLYFNVIEMGLEVLEQAKIGNEDESRKGDDSEEEAKEEFLHGAHELTYLLNFLYIPIL